MASVIDAAGKPMIVTFPALRQFVKSFIPLQCSEDLWTVRLLWEYSQSKVATSFGCAQKKGSTCPD